MRAPKSGTEHYTGLSRAKLYDGIAKGHFRSASLREPGQVRGTRLFNLQSILTFIEGCEEAAGDTYRDPGGKKMGNGVERGLN